MPVAHEEVLYQDRRWRGALSRIQYGFLAYPLLIWGLIGGISKGWSTVVLVLSLFVPPIAICEWRLRKMGFVLREDCIVLIRALNSTRIPWSEIDSLVVVAPGGWIDYGNGRVGVKRRRNRLIPRATIKLPTVWVSSRPRARWVPPFGPSGLKWSGGEIADVMGLLNDRLDAHRDSPQAPSSVAAAC